MPRVNTEPVFTSFGWTSECRGVRRTSSKVRTTSFLTRGNPCSVAADPLMRESPLPAFAGEAGLLDGRVVVAIAKCMALCGLRPEVGPMKKSQPVRYLTATFVTPCSATAYG